MDEHANPSLFIFLSSASPELAPGVANILRPVSPILESLPSSSRVPFSGETQGQCESGVSQINNKEEEKERRKHLEERKANSTRISR